MREHVITRATDLQALCDRLRRAGRFAFDTEFVGEGQFHPTLCLVQVATEDEIAIIDPLTMGNPVGLWELMTEEDVEVVVHAGRADIRQCYHWSGGRLPRRIFDVQVAAGFIGLPYPASHSLLVKEILGVELKDEATLSDWRRRPLTPQQLRYAADDVRYLLQMRDRLEQELRALGRTSWAEEEFERRVKMAVAREEGLSEPWRKLKGTRNLHARQLAALERLFAWREDVAYRENRPARQVCSDHVLVELAKRLPRKAAAIRMVRGINERYVDDIVRIVQEVLQLPEKLLPSVLAQDPPQLHILVQLLITVLNSLCVENSLSPQLVATQEEVRNWLRNRLIEDSGPRETPLDTGWRRSLVTPRLEACLRGELTVRVRDPHSENPLALQDLAREE